MKITGRRLCKPKYLAVCSIAVLSTQLQAGPTIQLNGDAKRDGMADSGRVGYVGGNTRIGVSINRDLEGQIDINQLIMDDDSSATSAEGWFGYKIKDDEQRSKGLTRGGVKLNHQWANDDKDTVHKAFAAYDQDVDERAKATVGYGQETEDLFWSGQVSKGFGDDKVTATTKTRAYDYGVGIQAGTFLNSTLTRIRGGVDYEFGTDYANDESRPSKATVSAGVEQFFDDSPHSITLDVSGNQASGGNRTDNKDFGASVGYRYEFGGDGVYRSASRSSRRRVEIPGKPGRPGRPAVAAIPPTPATPARPAIPAIPAKPGTAATPAQQARAATPPLYERRAVSTPGHEFVKTTMKLENETFFGLNSFKLTPSAKRNLDKIISQIRGQGYLGVIRITGNTCGLGDPAYDQRLSESRAKAVRNYLIQQGLNPAHLIARGLGKGSPKYDRRDNDFKNRRVDLEYVTERRVNKANKATHRNVLIQAGRPAVAAIPGRPAIPAQAGRAGRPAQPARAGSPGRPATPAVPAMPATPARFVWKTEVIPSAPIWIQRAIRNTISHNKSISTYTTRRVSKAVDDIITITSREETSINVLANDDPGLRLLSASEPKDGTVRIINDRIIYTPNATFTGSDTFTYTVIDSNNRQTTSRVTVNVSQATNSAPIAMDDNVTTKFETPVTINVTANDRDIDGDISCISNIARQPSEGSVTIASNGLDIIYTPNSGFIGTDTFEYTVCDEKGAIDSATVTVTTTSLGLNAMDDSDSTDYETAVTIHVAENDVNLDGGYTCVLSIPDEPDNGFVVISNNGQDIVYTPHNNFIGSDSFTYTACDSEGDRDDATVTVAVRAP